ncbi:HupE/UreJ family protein [Rhizorhabdus argentea]|uniref:HupE/UreJ family protein n=1 Tax=Rhizorhabdus argentea TaxID=1387174 RepID=UPI0030EC9156
MNHRLLSPRLSWIALPFLLAASPALAHAGHGAQSSFAAGLLHPFTGLDHLLTMLMVGLWAGIAFPQRWWVCPTAFMAFMLTGFAYGAAGGTLPIAEMLITASLVGLGVALFADVRAPLAASAGVIALFAIGHGFAHGSEMAAGAGQAQFAGGFLISTAMLHGFGLALSRWATGVGQRRVGQTTGLVAVLAAATMMWPA